MPYYIKANPKVAEYLGLTKARAKTPDGNYLLWQADMNVFGGQFRLDAICLEIGASKLTPLEQKRELEGTYRAAMPVASDPRFVMDAEAESEEETDTIELNNEETDLPAEETETDEPDNEPDSTEEQ